jgi:hypothetical protein
MASESSSELRAECSVLSAQSSVLSSVLSAQCQRWAEHRRREHVEKRNLDDRSVLDRKLSV